MSQSEWNQIPIRTTTKIKLSRLRRVKENRKPREHIIETFDDVVMRLIGFYDENSPSVK